MTDASSAALPAPIVLIGFMGSGKSSVARRASRLLHRAVSDLDALIEAEVGYPVAQYFARVGEASFRDRETAALERALQSPDIVATGGGIVGRETNRALLREASERGAHIVYLRAQPATLTARIRRQPGQRPLIDGDGGPLDWDTTLQRVEEILATREPFYRACATLILDTDRGNAQSVAARLARCIQEG